MRITSVRTIGRALLVAALPMAVTLAGTGAGSAAAAPVKAPAAQTITASGVDHGVRYSTAIAADGVVTNVNAGHFALSPDNKSVALTSPTGAHIVSLALNIPVQGGNVALTPRIDQSGKSLTLTPVAGGSSWPRLQALLQKGATQAAIGGLIGFLLPPGDFVGAAIGAAIGEYIANGPVVLDTAIAVLQGH